MTPVEWLLLAAAAGVVVAVDLMARAYTGGDGGHVPAAAKAPSAPLIERRDFLKLVGAGAAGAGAGWLYGVSKQRPARILLSQPVMPEDFSPGVATWYNTVCRRCAAGCGIMVRTREGRAKKIEGNPAHPVSQGKVCARGQAGPQVLYNPDRVKAPLVRDGASFTETDWGDALARAASGLRDGGGVVLLSGAVRGHLDRLFADFAGRMGAEYLQYEFDHPAALYEANRRSFGVERMPYYDIANAGMLVSFGADFLGGWLSPVHHGIGYGHMRQGRPGRRGRVVQVEARMSLSGANADAWMPALPGSEGVLALALARHLVNAGIYDGADADRWRAALDRYTPEFTAERTGLDAARISRLAADFAAASNRLAIGGGAAAHSVNGVANMTAINVLNFLAGAIGHAGGVVFNPDSALGDAGAGRMATFARMRQLADDARAGRIGTLVVNETNPVFSLPEAAGFAEALERIPTVVVLGQFVDETAALADVILPTHSDLERWGDDAPEPGVGFPVATISQPVVAPLYDTRPPGDVILALAERAGDAMPWTSAEVHLQQTWREIHARHGNGGSFESFWRAALAAGVWGLDNARAEQSVAAPDPSSLDGLEFRPAAEVGGRAFSLQPYVSPSLHDGRGANLPWLQELPDPLTAIVYGSAVELNPQTARELGLSDGDVVEVSSAQGSLRAPVITYPAIRPDAVGIAIGQGHSRYGRYASERGVNPLRILDADTDAAGALAWASTRVDLHATGERARVIRNSGVPRELGRNILGGDGS